MISQEPSKEVVNLQFSFRSIVLAATRIKICTYMGTQGEEPFEKARFWMGGCKSVTATANFQAQLQQNI